MRLALIASLLCLGCREPAALTQPRLVKQIGPGCWLTFRNVIDTLGVNASLRVHYPVCPTVTMDTTYVSMAP